MIVPLKELLRTLKIYSRIFSSMVNKMTNFFSHCPVLFFLLCQLQSSFCTHFHDFYYIYFFDLSNTDWVNYSIDMYLAPNQITYLKYNGGFNLSVRLGPISLCFSVNTSMLPTGPKYPVLLFKRRATQKFCQILWF